MLRTLDILLCAVGLIFAAPLIILAALFIKRDSPGPAIFAQTRVGRNRRLFTCYKLRTMAAGTRQGASHEVGAATITRIGAVLRRTKLDELPQLWNVLKGEMSLVGPRPCLPSQDVLIEARDRRRVFTMRPGITGLAQVAGLDMSQPVLLAEADARWIGRESPLAYVAIIAQTAFGAGSGDAASNA